MTAPSTFSKCAVRVDVPGTTIPAAGGAGTINVQTERECQWTAQPEVSWLSISAGSSGQGPGAVQFAATANADPVARTGGVMINGQRAQVSQAAGECRFELSSNGTAFQIGGTGSVDVRASSPLCTWTAVSNVEWISINSNANGKGSAPVTFTVASTTGPPRTGGLTIAGQHFSVTQSEGCSYAVTPTTFSLAASGGSATFDVRTADGCGWAANANVNWLSITAGATGSGNGTVSYTAAANTGPQRSGTITAGGQTFTVVQATGCAFSISPVSQGMPAGGGSASFTVNTSPSCAWTAVADASWISVTSGASGNGPGSVQFVAAPNSGAARSGTIAVAGQTFTVTQESGCSAVVAPDTLIVPAAGGSQTVSISTAADCAWTAASNASWIAIAMATSGSGNGTVRLDMQANADAARSGTATIAGKVVTVNQDSGCTISLNPASTPMVVGGGTGSVTVTTGAGCAWTAVSGVTWITVTGGASGSGPGTVTFSVDANVSGTTRAGSITIGSQLFTVNQAGT